MIDIVIAIYNPDKYLDEQIDSILCQSRIDMVNRIIITDDSDTISDVTKNNLAKDDRIEYHKNLSKKGAKNNFLYGLSLTTSDLIMTCDQDDIWHNDKIEISLAHCNSQNMKEPLLIGTDVMLCDKNGISMGCTYLQRMKVDSNGFHKRDYLFSNFVPGCTMLFNRKLLEVASPVPEAAVMHDWWLLINAVLKGKFKYIPKPTMLYRQHDSNVIGAKRRTHIEIFRAGNWFNDIRNYKNVFERIVDQASSVKYSQEDEIFTIIMRSGEYKNYSSFRKVAYMIKYAKTSWIKKLAFATYIFGAEG